MLERESGKTRRFFPFQDGTQRGMEPKLGRYLGT